MKILILGLLSFDKIILRYNIYLFEWEGVGDIHITGCHIEEDTLHSTSDTHITSDIHISLVICVRGYSYHCDLVLISYPNSVNCDRPGECSPEKDCLR